MDTPPHKASEGHLIESDRRVSESLLWQLQRRFYDQRGPSAWKGGGGGTVPSYVTSNPYIAQMYAGIVFAFLRDAVAAGASGGLTLDPARPVYIVELASGLGRFAYLFLKKFLALKSASPALRALDCRYVMTDFTMTNVQAWAAQPLLKPFVAAGQLELGVFDAERDEEIKLTDGRVLSARTVENPLVVLANYAFDTLTHDLFRVEGGRLHEVRLALRSELPYDPAASPPELMKDLGCRYSLRPIGPDYYGDPLLDRVLAYYVEHLTETTFPVPLGALTALRRLGAMSKGRLFVLSSDKGYTWEDELSGLNGQHIEFHGSLSMMVNYHAIGRYVLEQGGVYEATSQRDGGLRTAAFLLGGDAERFADTLLAFRERANVFSAADFYVLLSAERKDAPSISLEHFLSLLRMSHYDPYVVHSFYRDVLNALQTVSEGLAVELRLALERVWDNFYPAGADLAFELGRVYMALKRPREGARMNQLSIDLFGPTVGACTNLGMCHYFSERLDDAIRCFDQALALDPHVGFTRAWRTRAVVERDRMRGVLASTHERSADG